MPALKSIKKTKTLSSFVFEILQAKFLQKKTFLIFSFEKILWRLQNNIISKQFTH